MSIWDKLEPVEVEPLPCSVCKTHDHEVNISIADFLICDGCYSETPEAVLAARAVDSEWEV